MRSSPSTAAYRSTSAGDGMQSTSRSTTCSAPARAATSTPEVARSGQGQPSRRAADSVTRTSQAPACAGGERLDLGVVHRDDHVEVGPSGLPPQAPQLALEVVVAPVHDRHDGHAGRRCPQASRHAVGRARSRRRTDVAPCGVVTWPWRRRARRARLRQRPPRDRWTTGASPPRRGRGPGRADRAMPWRVGQARTPTATPSRSTAAAVAICSSKGRGWATTTAGRRAAATSATAFWPPCVTTTSAAARSAHRSGDGEPGPRSTHSQPGVAARAAATSAADVDRPPPPQRRGRVASRAATDGRQARRGDPAVEARDAPRPPTACRAIVRPARRRGPPPAKGRAGRRRGRRPGRGRGRCALRASRRTTTGTPHSRTSAATSTDTSTTTSDGRVRATHSVRCSRPVASPASCRGTQCSTPPAVGSAPATSPAASGRRGRAAASPTSIRPGAGRELIPVTGARRCSAMACSRVRWPSPWWWT